MVVRKNPRDNSIPVMDEEAMRQRRFTRPKKQTVTQRLADTLAEALIDWEYHRWTKRGILGLTLLTTTLLALVATPWLQRRWQPEPYGSSHCHYTLVYAEWLPQHPLTHTHLQHAPLEKLIQTQECYLNHYHYTCIHPLSYGLSYPIISYKDKYGIHHWIEPTMTETGPKTIETLETSSFWPQRKPTRHNRPEWVTFTAATPDHPTKRTWTVRGEAAVCLDQWTAPTKQHAL